jgi:hypothetical protein
MAFLKAMLIEVEKDIVKAAIDVKDDRHKTAIDVLRELVISIRRGNHIVYVPCLKEKSTCDDLKKVLPFEFALLRHSLIERDKIGLVLQTVENRIICTFSQPKKQPNTPNRIYINPLTQSQFRWYEETRVIAENLSDVQFYQYVFKFFTRSNKLKGIKSAMEFVLGGGATTYRVVEHECSSNKHPVVIIADSDKNYPEDEIGNTAKNIVALFSKNGELEHHEISRCYVLHFVRECENLIPSTFYDKSQSKEEFVRFLQSIDCSYYDLKSGLTCYSLCEKKSCNYWKRIIPLLNVENVEKCEHRKHEIHSCKKSERICVVDHSLCAGFLSDLVDNKNYIGLDAIEENDLSEAQKIEWNTIGRILFDWTCSMKPERG